MTFGITMDWWSLYFQRSGGISLPREEGGVPMERLPRSLNTETSYSSVSSPTDTTLSVRPGEIRNWMSCGAAGSLLDVETLSETRVRVSQPYSFDFDFAWILVDGMAYPLSGLAQGVHEYLIQPQSAIHLVALPLEVAARDGSSVSMILGELVSAFALGKGDWLLAIADRSHLDHHQGVQKVRDMAVALVSVEAGGDRAI
jgi:hypothetical protein